jgi:hypothetical protein
MCILLRLHSFRFFQLSHTQSHILINKGGFAFALFLLEEGEYSLLIRQPKKVDDSSSPTTGKIECCNVKIP